MEPNTWKFIREYVASLSWSDRRGWYATFWAIQTLSEIPERELA